MQHSQGAIGVFDSGYGGLTVLKEITKLLPQYNYMYLGDNARAPYGPRSFETVYAYTWQCVQWFFEQGCHLVIIACNTASAKALRNIQQKNLPLLPTTKKVLGVIRPTTETLGNYTQSNQVGIMATAGTVASNSYAIEMQKFFPNVTVHQQACPLLVPIIENGEQHTAGANFFINNYVKKLLEKETTIDTILLACTHYPIIQQQIAAAAGNNIKTISQGSIVANSLVNYLQRHPEVENALLQQGEKQFYTTDSVEEFNKNATIFYGEQINSQQVKLD